ncbi:hypothetical protein C8R47DRAFT_1240487 [Mycena vitilis]|nr:hypothetical protein C8R47DRAFT_1240487 [Mycena vitilis]
MYLNANITGALLKPLLQYQSSSAYTNPYAAPDLGSAYPAVPGNPNDTQTYGVENSGNMLILVLAHARSTGDVSLIHRYYGLLKGWADYLVTNALIPEQQTSSDAQNIDLGQAHGNVTNLALKGVIAIQAMSEISQSVDQTADAKEYGRSAKDLIESWGNLTSVSGQLRWTYGESSSGLMYNLLADKLLQLDLVLPSIYAQESTTILSNGQDWTLFSAAAAPDTVTRDLLISSIHKRVSANLTEGPFATVYNVQTGVGPAAGVPPNGFASPAQGAMFSLLALNLSDKITVIPAAAASPSKKNTGVIVGTTIAVVTAVLLVAGITIFLRRRRRWRAMDELSLPQPYRRAATASTALNSPSVTGSPLRARKAELAATDTPETEALSSETRSGGGPNLSHGTGDLRSEMQRLRAEMDQLHLTQDAPPRYQ